MNPDADTIRNAIRDCLLTNAEVAAIDPDDMEMLRTGNPDQALLDKYSLKTVRAVTLSFGFNKARLEKYRDLVADCIKNIDPAFRHMGGSFLMLCMRKDGSQWGEHRNCDELIALAMGLDMCEFPTPRKMWGVLPGGVPLVKFKLPQEVECKTT